MTYRIYIVSDQNVIAGAFNREFADDGAAMDHARRYLTTHPALEIWQTDRMVGRVEREPLSAPERDGRPQSRAPGR